MAQFRQKNFFWNMALMVVGTGVSYLQGQKQNEEIQKQGEEQEKANEKQEELLKEQNRKLSMISERVKANPKAAASIPAALQGTREKYYAATGGLLKGLANSKWLENAKGFGKDILNYVNSKGDKVVGGKLIQGAGDAPRRQVLLGNVMMGTAAGVGGYAANKIIQADRRKQGFNDTLQDTPQQRAYSFNWGEAWKSAKNLGKETWKHNKKAAAFGLAFSAIPVIQYGTTRFMENRQKKLGESPQQGQQQQPVSPSINEQQKQYSMFNIGSVAKGFRTLASHPGRTILGGANKAMSFGAIGQKEIGNFANTLSKSKNAWSSRLGNMMLAKDKAGNIMRDEFGNVMANKKALLGSVGISSAVVGGAWSKSEGAVKGLGKKLDPNAYAYEENQKSMMS